LERLDLGKRLWIWALQQLRLVVIAALRDVASISALTCSVINANPETNGPGAEAAGAVNVGMPADATVARLGEGDLCRSYLPVAPMMAMPAMPPAPVTVPPTPVTVTPTPMAMVPAPVMAMPPPHLLGLEPFDLLTRCHGWIGIRFIFN
jgi:hypothetical protein